MLRVWVKNGANRTFTPTLIAGRCSATTSAVTRWANRATSART